MEKETNENVGQKEAEMENTESTQNQTGKRTAAKTSPRSNEARSKRQAEHEKRRLGVTEIVIPQICKDIHTNAQATAATPETPQATSPDAVTLYTTAPDAVTLYTTVPDKETLHTAAPETETLDTTVYTETLHTTVPDTETLQAAEGSRQVQELAATPKADTQQTAQAESLNDAGNTPEPEQQTAQAQEEVSEIEMAEALENAEAVKFFQAQEMEIPKMGEKSIQPAAASKPLAETRAAKAKSLDEAGTAAKPTGAAVPARPQQSAWSTRRPGTSYLSFDDANKCRNVVRLHYCGDMVPIPDRFVIGQDLIKVSLGFQPSEVNALFHAPHSRNYEVSFKTPEGLEKFWSCYREVKDNPEWEFFKVIQVSRPVTVEVNIIFDIETVAVEDIHFWLQRQCDVQSGPVKNMDAEGFWNGGYKFKVKLSSECDKDIVCNLCYKCGHSFKDCPEAEHNHYGQNDTESSESLQLTPVEEVLKSRGLTYMLPAQRGLGCKLRGLDLTGLYKHGDILIGIVIPFQVDVQYLESIFIETPRQGACKFFYSDVFPQFQAMRFTMEEINRRHDLLPNLTLGFQIYDSCRVLQRELDGTLKILTGQSQGIPNFSCREKPPLAAIIGHSTSTYSILMAHILGLYRYPQISIYSTSSLLSDRIQFPSFFRTVPSDAFQSQGLAQLVLHFGWTWVGLVALGNDYGQQGIQVIKQEILKAGACVAFTEFILLSHLDMNTPQLIRVIRESTATAVVVFSTDFDMIPLLDEMLRQNVTGKIFVASEAWSISNILSVEKYSTILSGCIGFAFYSSKIAGFREYLNSVRLFNSTGEIWAKKFWEEIFGCKFLDQRKLTGSLSNLAKLCTGNEDLESIENSYNDVSNVRGSYNVYTAIYLVAKALHDLKTCQEGRGRFYNGSCPDIHNFKPWQLLHYIQNVRVRLSNGREVFFDKNGDLPAVYDIVNWQLGADGMMRQVKVGSFDTAASDGKIFNINESAVVWALGRRQAPESVCSQSCHKGFRRVMRRGEPVCCFQCVSCSQGEISNLTDSIDCFKCPWDMWPSLAKDRCLPKTIEFLSYEEALGATLAATSLCSSMIPVFIIGLFIHYKNTPIVRANNYTLSCLLLGSLSFCFLCSLAFIGYPKPEKCLLRQAAFGMVFALCVSCILAKTFMVVFAFMATKPGSNLRKWTSPRVSYMIIVFCSFLQFLVCISWLLLSPPFQENNIQSQPGVIIAECNEGSPIAFWCMLGYLGLLATISFIVAFLARRLPGNFNEAKFITFSMLAFLSVWVSFIPASLSARGKYTVAMEIFAILSSSWALVVCMFVPKCFIIMFRPNMNLREHLMGKAKGSS
ncbi:vomeronasal type-2 receptor 1-like [Ascaphus truei]|uniref:vomeronasal type-2 receptor 1-like n=1 Tax=Ascaphus truei TaxID=8439 RepID=UPI003F59C28A